MSLYRILLYDGHELLMDFDPKSHQAPIYVRIADDWILTPYTTADASLRYFTATCPTAFADADTSYRHFTAACLVAAYVQGDDVARVVRLTGASQAT